MFNRFTGLKYSGSSSAFSLKMECKLYIQSAFPQNTARWTNIGLMVAHCLRRWSSIKHTLVDVSCFLDCPSLPVEGVCVRGGGGYRPSMSRQSHLAITSPLAANHQRRLPVCCAITSGIMWYPEMIICRWHEKRCSYGTYTPIKTRQTYNLSINLYKSALVLSCCHSLVLQVFFQYVLWWLWAGW